MRKIFFRGKDKKGKWIYGSHFFDGEKHFIVTKKSECFYEEFVVDPKTLGEYTGVHDKEGNEIYECENCKMVLARDHNSAINILKLGQELSYVENNSSVSLIQELSMKQEAPSLNLRI